MKRERRKDKLKFYLGLYDATSIGISVVVAILIGGLLGYWLDRKFHSAYHWLFFLFLFFGIAAGFKNMFYGIKKRLNENNDKKT